MDKQMNNETAAQQVCAIAATQTVEADRWMLEELAKDIFEGKTTNLVEYVSVCWDTYLRDEIPGEVWKFIGGRTV